MNERLRTNLKEMFDPESDVHDQIVYEVIHRFLDIPGVREAVIADLYKTHAVTSLRWLSDEWGTDTLGDLPFCHVWERIFNQV